MHFATTL